jgi:hypothetical protein
VSQTSRSNVVTKTALAILTPGCIRILLRQMLGAHSAPKKSAPHTPYVRASQL